MSLYIIVYKYRLKLKPGDKLSIMHELPGQQRSLMLHEIYTIQKLAM